MLIVWDRSVSHVDSTAVAGFMSEIIDGKASFVRKDHELRAWKHLRIRLRIVGPTGYLP
jgi:hypothetical protein